MHSTARDSEQLDKLRNSGPIVAANVSADFNYLVTASSDKTVRAWDLNGLHVVSERCVFYQGSLLNLHVSDRSRQTGKHLRNQQKCVSLSMPRISYSPTSLAMFIGMLRLVSFQRLTDNVGGQLPSS